ncbi:methylated-DNA--[protein]-cysteine S-methyltransferase [Sulfurovum sp. XTW-4]|uniref:Methylated-DNA--protein-cysteine methyltransferase n=1 Tax=Sulfurovum xiamenensis TaxID=3019066 RepID=A0ABT7QTX7_9BACT|nr:methylated-DNA--[protein]-cysteine S-methyltransferase [Sulfurovum xiamenensis]MDM5264541.1 methylated-DNA--[protein]-cysteine S-methyltransferase [Sulfurovum xiamenensis]
MNTISIQYFQTPVGEMILGSYDDKLCMADWRYRKGRESIDRRVQKGLHAIFVEEESEVLNLAKEELEAYFKGLRQKFDIPLLLVGTEFQKSVWKGLLQISFGTTVSYKDLAQNIDNKTAVRAVASAVGANAMSIFIPCHRVVGSDSSLRGYAGGLEAKKKLLALEQNMFTI